MNPDVAILEFRPGPGGDEAKIWAADLLRMYTRYANLLGWNVEALSDTTIRIRGQEAQHLVAEPAPREVALGRPEREDLVEAARRRALLEDRTVLVRAEQREQREGAEPARAQAGSTRPEGQRQPARDDHSDRAPAYGRKR